MRSGPLRKEFLVVEAPAVSHDRILHLGPVARKVRACMAACPNRHERGQSRVRADAPAEFAQLARDSPSSPRAATIIGAIHRRCQLTRASMGRPGLIRKP